MKTSGLTGTANSWATFRLVFCLNQQVEEHCAATGENTVSFGEFAAILAGTSTNEQENQDQPTEQPQALPDMNTIKQVMDHFPSFCVCE